MKERIAELVNAMLKEAGEDATATPISVLNNNGIRLDGITIKRQGSDIAPTIYYNPDWDVEDIAKAIFKKWQSAKGVRIDTSGFLNKEGILDRVYPIFANREANRELLMDAVHEPFLDMEILFRIDPTPETSLLIRQDLAEYCKVSNKELMDAAILNIQGKGKIHGIGSRILEAQQAPPEILATYNENDDPMVIISNERNSWGAGYILDKAVIEYCEKKFGNDFFLIPSSIHEMLAVSAKGVDPSDIKDIIKIVNAENLDEKEFLSNTLYRYTDGIFKQEVAA